MRVGKNSGPHFLGDINSRIDMLLEFGAQFFFSNLSEICHVTRVVDVFTKVECVLHRVESVITRILRVISRVGVFTRVESVLLPESRMCYD